MKGASEVAAMARDLLDGYAALGWAEAFEKVEPAIERYKLSLVDFKKNAFGKRALSSEAEAAVRYRWRAWFEDLGYE